MVAGWPEIPGNPSAAAEPGAQGEQRAKLADAERPAGGEVGQDSRGERAAKSHELSAERAAKHRVERLPDRERNPTRDGRRDQDPRDGGHDLVEVDSSETTPEKDEQRCGT